MAPGPVWTGVENLVPTGIRSPDRPARSQLLYRLSYLAYGMQWQTFRSTEFIGDHIRLDDDRKQQVGYMKAVMAYPGMHLFTFSCKKQLFYLQF